MTLVTPPSFNSAEALSARFMYKRMSADRSSSDWVLGTTGDAFMRVAWNALERFQFEEHSAYPTLATDGRTGPLGLFFGGRLNLAPEVTARRFQVLRGSQTYWDNDFNRALWSWSYQQWVASRRARGQESPRTLFRQRLARGGAALVPALVPFLPLLAGQAIDETRREMETPEFRTWWGLLDAIEQCELEQRVNATALRMACVLVALRLQLIARTDASYVSLLSEQTVPPPYNRSPAQPDPNASFEGRQFKIWSEGRGESSGSFVSNDPARPTPAAPPEQGGAVPPEGPGVPGVAAPIPTRNVPPPVQGMSAGKAVGITVGYTIGAVMAVAGVATAIVKRNEEALGIDPRFGGP